VVRDVIERCEMWVQHVEVLHTTHPDAGVELLAHATASDEEPGSPIDLVIAEGGDGTVREIGEGLARSLNRWPSGGTGDGPVLFVVPAGSGNSAYHAMWPNHCWRDALEGLLRDGMYRRRNIDLVRLVEADRAALLGVNVGLIARMAEIIERMKADERSSSSGEAPAVDTADRGEQRYWTALGEALHDLEAFSARVTVDGETLHDGLVTLVTVGGVRCFGRGKFQLLPRSVLDDALIDVCVVADATSEGIAELAALVPSGGHLGRPGVAYGSRWSARTASGCSSSMTVTHGRRTTWSHSRSCRARSRQPPRSMRRSNRRDRRVPGGQLHER
jgi:diacylglycerol kinase (ATP)